MAQKGRKSKYHPWFFGIRFGVLIAAWDGYRIPVGFRLILPKRHAGYQNENALFREMVSDFIPPSWAQLVVVCGDAAYGSKANMKRVKDRDKADDERRWGFVFAIARTWKTVDEKMIKNLVTHLPRHLYQRTWIPKDIEGQGRKTFWTYGKVCDHRGSGVRCCSVEPGEIGLTPLEGTGHGINQHAKGGLAQLTAGLA